MAKRRKLKIKGLISILLFLTICTFILTFTIKYYQKNNLKEKNNYEENKEIINDPIEDDKSKVYKLKMLATGDGLIHNTIFRTYATGNNTWDFSGALSEVKDIISNYDLAYYNQETVFGGTNLGISGYPRFNTPSEYGDAMLNAGFNVVSLASNHTLDKGEEGIINSYKYWQTTNALYHGIADSRVSHDNSIMIKEKNNITYTLLSYTEMTNGLPVPKGKDYLVNVYDPEKVKEDIESVRDKVDLLIVAMHWGVEYQDKPNAKQQEIASYLASLGVDIIIGNHPHVLQPVTFIDDTLVFYSLGNFISNQYGTGDFSKLISVLATFDITKTVDNDKTDITIDNLGGEMIFTSYTGDPIKTATHSDHKVIPFSKMTDDTYLKDYKRLYTKYVGVLESMGTDLNITPLPN